MLHNNCLVGRRLILVSFFIVPLWMLFLTNSLIASEGGLVHEDRLAALECQRGGFFVIVNYFPSSKILLTAGEEENLRIVDAEVKLRISQSKNQESYFNSNVSLTLPLNLGAGSDQNRIGKIKIKNPPLELEDLNCLLHGAD